MGLDPTGKSQDLPSQSGKQIIEDGDHQSHQNEGPQQRFLDEVKYWKGKDKKAQIFLEDGV